MDKNQSCSVQNTYLNTLYLLGLNRNRKCFIDKQKLIQKWKELDDFYLHIGNGTNEAIISYSIIS